MRKFRDFEAKKIGGRELLPAGGYVAKILDAKEVNYDWGSVIQISFDISEGPNKDFFKRDYNNQDREDKKWRGTYRLNVPNDDGSEKDGWTKRTFGNAIWAIESSNPGYHFDWDETSFRGKNVGVLYRNREWEMNGNTGWTTECCSLASADEVRDGNFRMPKDKPLANKPAAAGFGFGSFAAIGDDDNELPFN